MSKYLHIDDECEASKQVLDSDLTVYELKSIVIHRGGPYGGHYHAFIRDDLGEGKWDLELPEKFDDKPKDTTLKEEEKKLALQLLLHKETYRLSISFYFFIF